MPDGLVGPSLQFQLQLPHLALRAGLWPLHLPAGLVGSGV